MNMPCNGTPSMTFGSCFTSANSAVSVWWNQADVLVFSDAYSDLKTFVSDLGKRELESDFEFTPACLVELVRKTIDDYEFRKKLECNMAYLLLKSSHISVWMLSACLEKAPFLDSKRG